MKPADIKHQRKLLNEVLRERKCGGAMHNKKARALERALKKEMKEEYHKWTA